MAIDIAELLRAHDERALEEVNRRYGAHLLFLSESITHDARDAEECVNDAYLALWHASDVSSPAAFLMETVRHLSYNRIRSEKAQKRTGGTLELTEQAHDIADSNEPWNAIENGELRDALSEFFDSLSPENRLIFVRRHIYSDSYSGIGHMIGVSENVISVRLVRMREGLRRALEEKGIISEDKFKKRRGSDAGEAVYVSGSIRVVFIPLPDDYSDVMAFSEEELAGVNRADGRVGFIDGHGQVKIPFLYYRPENDEEPPMFSEGLASVIDENDRLGFIDTDGNTVIGFEYDGNIGYSYFVNGSAVVYKDGRRLRIDKQGRQIHTEYEKINRDGDFYHIDGDRIAVMRGGKLGYVDKDDNTVIPFIYEYDEYGGLLFSDGLLRVRRDGKYCYVDRTGAEIIPPLDYIDALHFCAGYAVVSVAGVSLPADPNESAIETAVRERKARRHGLIDKRGLCVVPPVYSDIRFLDDEEVYLLQCGGVYSLFDRGRVSVILRDAANKYDRVQHKYGRWFGVMKDGKEGIIDIFGREVVPPEYEMAAPFLSADSGGIIVLRRDGKCSVCRPFGEPLTPFLFDRITPDRISPGVGEVGFAKKGGALGILRVEADLGRWENKRDIMAGRTYIVSPIENKFDSINMFRDGIADAVNRDGSVGFIDRTGKLKIPVKYKTPVEKRVMGSGETAYVYTLDSGFSCGLACVCDGEKFGYINKNDEVVIPFIYDDAQVFNRGRAEVVLDGERMCIDDKGRVIFKFSDIARDYNVEELLVWQDDLICVVRDGKMGYVDVRGNTVVPFIYDDPWEEGYPDFPSDGLIHVRRGGRHGYVDLSGNEVIPAELGYDGASGFLGGYAPVFVLRDDVGVGHDIGAAGKRRFGLIDKMGREAVPLEYDMIYCFYKTPGMFLALRADRAEILDCGDGCRVISEISGYSGFRSIGNYIAAVRDGKWALFDLSGKMVLPPEYEVVVPQGKIARVRDGGKWGAVGLPGGNLIVPLIYDSIGMLDDDGYAIARADDDIFVLHIE